MWKSWAIPVALAAACVTSPLAAATTLEVDTSTAERWEVVTPGGATVAANSITRNPAWADVSWISSATSGTQNIAPGTYQYVFTLGQPGLFGLLSGLVYVDNRLESIFVNGDTNLGITLADLGERQFEPGAGREISFDLSQYGVISTITFQTMNDSMSNNPAGFSSALSAPAIPEPGTWMLMILGLGAVGFSMRRRQNTSVRLQFA